MLQWHFFLFFFFPWLIYVHFWLRNNVVLAYIYSNLYKPCQTGITVLSIVLKENTFTRRLRCVSLFWLRTKRRRTTRNALIEIVREWVSNIISVPAKQNRKRVHVFIILLIGHFRVVFCLWVKMSLLAKLAIWKRVSIRQHFHFHANQTYFHMKFFAPRLVLKPRHETLAISVAITISIQVK